MLGLDGVFEVLVGFADVVVVTGGLVAVVAGRFLTGAVVLVAGLVAGLLVGRDVLPPIVPPPVTPPSCCATATLAQVSTNRTVSRKTTRRGRGVDIEFSPGNLNCCWAEWPKDYNAIGVISGTV